MAGSPSHSVRDIQEPPRSWVGVCIRARTVQTGAVPELVRASLGWGNTRSINRISSNRRANGSAVEEGLDRRRQSHERPAQAAGKSEMSFPPCETFFVSRSAASCGCTLPSVRRADSKRLTYCFDRPRMRTLGSLTTVPERPVVRNARQPFSYDDRYHRANPLDRRTFFCCICSNSDNAFRARNARSRCHRSPKKKAPGKKRPRQLRNTKKCAASIAAASRYGTSSAPRRGRTRTALAKL